MFAKKKATELSTKINQITITTNMTQPSKSNSQITFLEQYLGVMSMMGVGFQTTPNSVYVMKMKNRPYTTS